MVWKLIQDIADHMIPWQQRIKDIESHFGSVVSSYFVFLRWIFWMNFAITLVLMFTVILPEVRFDVFELFYKNVHLFILHFFFNYTLLIPLLGNKC